MADLEHVQKELTEIRVCQAEICTTLTLMERNRQEARAESKERHEKHDGRITSLERSRTWAMGGGVTMAGILGWIGWDSFKGLFK